MLLQMMCMMRNNHMLTDVVLEVGSELFHAHKVVLAAASPYFKVTVNSFLDILRHAYKALIKIKNIHIQEMVVTCYVL